VKNQYYNNLIFLAGMEFSKKGPKEVSMPRKRNKPSKSSIRPAAHHRNKKVKRNLSWLWVSLGVLLVVVIGVLLLSPKTQQSVEITPAQAYAKYQQGAFFLDVRTQDEWNQGHIPGSTLIPLEQLQNQLSELPKGKDIVVVCLTGHRSLTGVTILQQAGFKHLSCLSGGLQAWMNANYPIQTGP
jgi:phage shock protein E